MSVTRKQFLHAGAAATLGLMLPGDLFARPLDTASLPDITTANLPGKDEMWRWMRQLADWCPMFTGGPGHTSLVNFLDEELRRSGLVPERKTFKLPYWDLKAYGIQAGGEKLHAAGYRPYSGPTPPSGVTAPLYNAGVAPNFDFSGARGKIVLMEMAPVRPPQAGAAGGAPVGLIGTNPPGASIAGSRGNALRGLTTDTSNMKPIEDAGAVGVVHIWSGVSDGNAQDQAIPPFGTPTTVPVVLVGHGTGERLKALAASGISATLVHHAVVHPDTPADNLWATLPGRSEEAIIVNTHTDGCNANEENGALAVVALARYFSKLPAAERKRTLVFLMTAGHFGHGYFRGTADWMQTNAELLKRTVACVTIEHLGALGWQDDVAANQYRPTGQGEWAVAHATRPAGEVFLRAAEGTAASNIYSVVAAGSYPGEGAGFFRAGVPVVSYIPTPQYLFVAPEKGGALDKLDKDRFYGEVVTFARTVAALDGMSAADIKGA